MRLTTPQRASAVHYVVAQRALRPYDLMMLQRASAMQFDNVAAGNMAMRLDHVTEGDMTMRLGNVTVGETV